MALAETGVLPLNLEEVDLAVLANGVADDFSEAARKAGAEISVRVDPDIVPIRADAARVRQALANLDQAFVDSEGGHKQLNALNEVLPASRRNLLRAR